MQYFSALADAKFARAAFAAAGLDFDALKSAENTDCLKTALAAAKTNADAETILAQAKKENDELAAKVAELEKAKKVAEATISNLNTAIIGMVHQRVVAIDAEGAVNVDEIKKAHTAAVTKAARDMVARAGHPGLLDDPSIDPTKQQKVEAKDPNAPELKGRERLAAAFQKEIAAQAKARSRN